MVLSTVLTDLFPVPLKSLWWTESPVNDRVQTPGYIPKKTRWVFLVHPPKKTHPQKPTLLL